MALSKIMAAIAALLFLAALAKPAEANISIYTNDGKPAFQGSGDARARTSPRVRSRSASRRHPAVLASLSPSNTGQPLLPTIGGYRDRVPAPDGPAKGGMTRIDVAGGHRITVSYAFAGPISSLIADLYGQGYRFSRIRCADSPQRGKHVRGSNHFGGDACDFFGRHPPAAATRAHGLRSGCDFRDCMHVDNARNVGGVAFWNSVKHRGPRATKTAAARRHHSNIRVARR